MNDRIGVLLGHATKKLVASGSETARLDAELLLCHVLQKPRSFLFTWPDKTLDKGQQSLFCALIQRRSEGVPVAYLTGEKFFWNLQLTVNEHVLIPRPDTELMVELALSRPVPDNGIVADLGTGTGAIALAMASQKPHWQVLAIDNSEQALHMAKANARRNHIHSVQFFLGNWCEPLAGKQLHMIVTNPPYIREDDPHLKEGDVRFEPLSALISGVDGLDDIRRIIQASASLLLPGGWLLIEHGYEQGKAVAQLLEAQGFSSVNTQKDLAGLERVTLGCYCLQ